MMYKTVSVIFALPAILLALVFSKSLSVGVTRNVNGFLGLLTIPCLLWSVASFVLLFGWWALVALPVAWALVLWAAAAFVTHVARMGDSILDAQTGYAILMIFFLLLSLLPYGLHELIG